ncbi:conserved hypothetical protein [Ricinus communis]|uniref:Regulator of Vps4 activity in the MVB pathway protein n=1 Tax=Ricinus communis TaxID=3988 RepID=B9RKS4_RICCO|nr:conserved hypothetical protein [Ricinus communis]|eukprot:XP_002514318.1 uncharacterized protein LOC8284809 [Ricinus communis]
MLDGILGRGFASKCKSLIKMTKSRIDVIRRKRNATLKFLKKDMADLLSNGLDINAYGRADGLLAELTLSSCYDFVEKSGDFVLKHLSIMQKIRHCPEDCREAVSSLMFAAARFSDLPELRDLRDVFYERYGSSLELFANQEFVGNLSSKPSTTEKKVQLMHEIASEFRIAWDSRAFEQRASKDSKPSASAQGQPKIYGPSYTHDDKYNSINGKDTVPKVKHDVLPKERLEHANDGYRLFSEKESNVSKRNGFDSQSGYEVPSNEYKLLNVREEPIQNRDTHDSVFQGRQEVIVEKHESQKGDITSKTVRNGFNSQSRYEVPSNRYQPLNVREQPNLKRDNHDSLFQGRQEVVEKREPWKEDASRRTVRSGSSSQRKRTESVDGGYNMFDGRENAVPKQDDEGTITHGKPETFSGYTGLWSKGDGKDSVAGYHRGPYGGQYNAANPATDVQEESSKLNPCCNNAIPPPYTKPNSKLKDGKYGGNLGSSVSGADVYVDPKDPSRNNRVYATNRSEKILQEAYYFDHERQSVGTTRANGNGHENDNKHKDDAISNPIPKPRSSRRKHSRSHAGHDDVGNLEGTGVVKRRSRSRRRDDSRRGLQVLFDDDPHYNDEEERIIDKLLIHYSKKPSAGEPGRVRRKSKSHHADDQGIEDRSPQHSSKDGADEILEMLPPPRSISLPREQTAPSEATKVFTRAASFQPDGSNPAKHVHPKLPDYDDLAARFAALKGR